MHVPGAALKQYPSCGAPQKPPRPRTRSRTAHRSASAASLISDWPLQAGTEAAHPAQGAPQGGTCCMRLRHHTDAGCGRRKRRSTSASISSPPPCPPTSGWSRTPRTAQWPGRWRPTAGWTAQRPGSAQSCRATGWRRRGRRRAAARRLRPPPPPCCNQWLGGGMRRELWNLQQQQRNATETKAPPLRARS